MMGPNGYSSILMVSKFSIQSVAQRKLIDWSTDYFSPDSLAMQKDFFSIVKVRLLL